MMGRTNKIALLANIGDNYTCSRLTSRRNVPTFHDEMDGVHDVVARGQGTQAVEDVGMKYAPIRGVHDATENGLGARDASEMGGELIHFVERMMLERRKLGLRLVQHVERKYLGKKLLHNVKRLHEEGTLLLPQSRLCSNVQLIA
jgi:hypothetical protein